MTIYLGIAFYLAGNVLSNFLSYNEQFFWVIFMAFNGPPIPAWAPFQRYFVVVYWITKSIINFRSTTHNTRTPTHLETHSSTHQHTHTHTHTLTHMQWHTNTHTQNLPDTHSSTHLHTHTLTHIQWHTNAHTPTHTGRHTPWQCEAGSGNFEAFSPRPLG